MDQARWEDGAQDVTVRHPEYVCCSTCHWWEARGSSRLEAENGDCIRRAPTTCNPDSGAFPLTDPHDFCGDWMLAQTTFAMGLPLGRWSRKSAVTAGNDE